MWFNYAYGYFKRPNRNGDFDPLTRTPLKSKPITAFATSQLVLQPIKKAMSPRPLAR